MRILIAIDDTDNLETPGTGHLASALSDLLEKNELGKGSPVTRHQLYVHPDIPHKRWPLLPQNNLLQIVYNLQDEQQNSR